MYAHVAATRMSIAYYNKIVEILESAPELQRTIGGICKQTCWVAGCTIGGGVVGGPLGAAGGGLAGVYFGYRNAADYRPLLEVVRNLNDDEQRM
jgi:hypothetical protein